LGLLWKSLFAPSEPFVIIYTGLAAIALYQFHDASILGLSAIWERAAATAP
jgi:hypothetical protein